MEMKIEWHKMKKESTKTDKIDVRGFADTGKQQQHKQLVQEATTRIEVESSSQEKVDKTMRNHKRKR